MDDHKMGRARRRGVLHPGRAMEGPSLARIHLLGGPPQAKLLPGGRDEQDNYTGCRGALWSTVTRGQTYKTWQHKTQLAPGSRLRHATSRNRA